jgi:hypothetical protein
LTTSLGRLRRLLFSGWAASSGGRRYLKANEEGTNGIFSLGRGGAAGILVVVESTVVSSEIDVGVGVGVASVESKVVIVWVEGEVEGGSLVVVKAEGAIGSVGDGSSSDVQSCPCDCRD